LPPALAYFLNTAFTPGMYLSYPSRARNRSNQGRRPPQQKRAAARQMTRGEGPHRARARASVRGGERSVGPTHLSRLFLISGCMSVSPRNESVTNSLAVRMLLRTNSSSPTPDYRYPYRRYRYPYRRCACCSRRTRAVLRPRRIGARSSASVRTRSGRVLHHTPGVEFPQRPCACAK
jgi:hypothetical protein